MQAARTARLLVVGQAPGRRVHDTGIPWNDPSGDTLREWLNLPARQFYDEACVAIMPMGFCYPGRAASGDMPPRPECAPLWHSRLLSELPDIRLTLLIGRHAQSYYLGVGAKPTLTATVAAYSEYLPRFFPLPHPSPRNRTWLTRNSWYARDVLPVLRQKVASILDL